MIKRLLNIETKIRKGKTLLILGPRQVGKTTLVENYLHNCGKKIIRFSGDMTGAQAIFSVHDLSHLQPHVAGADILFIDEAQEIPNIGKSLKIINDHLPKIAVIATGSSSFELNNQVGEPLVGRATTEFLYPLSLMEVLSASADTTQATRWQRLKNTLLVHGLYPDSFLAESAAQKQDYLSELSGQLLLKDILQYQEVKGSRVLMNLLVLLAHQIGGEVSMEELGRNLGINKNTVARYLDLLEKSFIIFRLGGFSRDLRNEITKKAKYFFYDTGIRNAVINNFNPLELRDDAGKLWENFVIAERMKSRAYAGVHASQYFWRTWKQDEIDLVEERVG
ncbi:MAG: ATP-binding protein [Verrucomicrobiales bacterium]|jgi:predicted AAA+ superfamily ATPase|nr:ATP-binding protein [Verrucomicrobiales bacterium]